MLETLRKIFSQKQLRNRIFYTILILLIYRLLAHIPMPGVNLDELKNFFSKNQVFGLLDLFSGGTLRSFSIVLMGVGPYITSSIIFQLLTIVIPSLENLSKEGEYGRQKINQYTRLATVPLAVIQAYSMLILLKSQGIIFGWDTTTLVMMLLASTTGTIILMWLGELISENGIGNGISLIIALGIISSLPNQIGKTLSLIGLNISWQGISFDFFDTGKLITAVIFLAAALVITGFIVLITEGERKIPISYARRVRGAQSYAAVESHLPLRVNTAGVIPIIFAISMMLFPPVVARFFEAARSAWLSESAKFITKLFSNQVFYAIAYFFLVVLFTFFYTSVVFQPKQVAENLQKQGGFIPGIRPGTETANYINYIIYRVTLIGAIFLGLIAILPYIVQAFTRTQTLVIGGTGVLIVVSVIIETMRQIKSQLVMHTYENF